MAGINKEQFRAICDEVYADLAVSNGDGGPEERTERLLQAVFERVCRHLGLSQSEQEKALDERPGFKLMQTLEEHMDPEFNYTPVIDDYLLRLDRTE